MGPIFATFLPMTAATVFLVPIVWRRRGSRGPGRPITRRDVGEFILIGLCGQVVAQLFIT
ncbi:MAG TPA: hypothetical protein VG206_08585 [Terriglobia bacterium]|nr:hypothetical protein [Terriglobia bacterium]